MKDYDNNFEGLNIKLIHIVGMLTELVKHVPVDETTRQHFEMMSTAFDEEYK